MVQSPCSLRDSQESSPTPQFRSISSSVLSFFMVQLSHPYITTEKTIALIRQTFVGKVMSLLGGAWWGHMRRGRREEPVAFLSAGRGCQGISGICKVGWSITKGAGACRTRGAVWGLIYFHLPTSQGLCRDRFGWVTFLGLGAKAENWVA